tara:strand:- start:5389 stop:6171 length:783 start_codon:yes stop_codon:yes gene_type:complete
LISENDKEDPDRDKGSGDGGKGGGDEGDGWEPLFGGYEWTEVSYDMTERVWFDSHAPRKYTSESRNAAYAIGVGYSGQSSAPDYENQYAMLFPSNDKRGRAMLVFEPPGGGSSGGGFLTAQIVGSSGSECSLGPSLTYQVSITEITDWDVHDNPLFETTSGNTFPAINLLELTGSDLGGTVGNTDPNCTVDIDPTPIPNGTNVLVSKIGVTRGTDVQSLLGFVIPNDVCVDCCNEGLTSRDQKIPSVRAPNDILSAMLVD